MIKLKVYIVQGLDLSFSNPYNYDFLQQSKEILGVSSLLNTKITEISEETSEFKLNTQLPFLLLVKICPAQSSILTQKELQIFDGTNHQKIFSSGFQLKKQFCEPGFVHFFVKISADKLVKLKLKLVFDDFEKEFETVMATSKSVEVAFVNSEQCFQEKQPLSCDSFAVVRLKVSKNVFVCENDFQIHSAPSAVQTPQKTFIEGFVNNFIKKNFIKKKQFQVPKTLFQQKNVQNLFIKRSQQQQLFISTCSAFFKYKPLLIEIWPSIINLKCQIIKAKLQEVFIAQWPFEAQGPIKLKLGENQNLLTKINVEQSKNEIWEGHIELIGIASKTGMIEVEGHIHVCLEEYTHKIEFGRFCVLNIQ